MTDQDRAAFDRAWGRFEGWLSAHAPIDQAALLPPAGAEAITTLEKRLGFALHPQLRALLERHDGVLGNPETENHHAGAFLPLGHRLIGTEQIASQHEWLAANAQLIAERALDDDDLYGHASQWVPFAHPNDGGLAFVDHRPGPAYGRVWELGLGSGCDGVVWAQSPAELFAALSDSLETDALFRGERPTPFALPSGHFCLSWDYGERQDGDRSGNWPPPRHPGVLKEDTVHHPLGRRLGSLSPSARRDVTPGTPGA